MGHDNHSWTLDQKYNARKWDTITISSMDSCRVPISKRYTCPILMVVHIIYCVPYVNNTTHELLFWPPNLGMVVESGPPPIGVVIELRWTIRDIMCMKCH